MIKISLEQVIFSPALIDQVNLDRAIERQFVRYKKDVSKIGTKFESHFIDKLRSSYRESILDVKTHPIPKKYALNTNKIQYKAYDGKDIEFDVV